MIGFTIEEGEPFVTVKTIKHKHKICQTFVA